MVFCQAKIKKTGNSRRSYCFTPEHDQSPYRKETKTAIDNASFVPASVNGENVEVLFSFRISFSWDGDVCNFAVIPNWGFDEAGMGFNYIAPQEILSGGHGWYRREPLFGGPGKIVLLARRGIMFSMSILVSPDGIPSDSRLEKNVFANEKEIRKALHAIERSRFIPGFYDGRPVAMRYYELLFVNPTY